jgi:hypothetical protein
MNIKGIDIAGILIYTILIVVALIAAYAEYKDDRCTEFKTGKCGPGMGSAYAAGIPDKNDSVDALLDKVRITARYEVNSIMWRRCFIGAVVASFLILYIAHKKVPNGLQLGITFLITYITMYIIITTFQAIVTRPALAQLDDILALLRKKGTDSRS